MSVAGIPGKIEVVAFTLINNYGQANAKQYQCWDMVSGMSIYENIFSDTMFGFAKFCDSYNLYSTLPITDATYIYIELKDPTTGKVVRGMYKVYKVSQIQTDSTKLQTYLVHFISMEMFNTRRVRINEHITGDIPGAIEKIHKQISKKKIVVTADAAKTDIILPYMPPLSAIHMLVENAKWKTTIPDYSYWETFDQFNCKSLSECMLSSPVHEISTNQQLEYGAYDDFGIQDFTKIKDVVVPQAFDSLNMLYGGYDGATIFSYDPITGTGYLDTVGAEPLSKTYVFSDRCLDYPALSKRQQLLRSISNTYYHVAVPGMLNRHSGDVASVRILMGNGIGTVDSKLSGNRLICGIAHQFNNDQYVQNLTLGDYYLAKSTSA